LSTSGIPTDSVTLTFGPDGAKKTVSVPVEATKELTTAALAKALNANSDFGAKYVAQVPTSVTLPEVAFNATPAAGDFSSFVTNIGGRTITVNNLAPSAATGSALAAEIENRLRREDSGNTDISVSWVGAGSPASATSGSLKVVDATGRLITTASLAPSTPTGGTTTGTPVFTSGELKVTAIDPMFPQAKSIRLSLLRKLERLWPLMPLP
jgi:hypothetical protein